MIFKTFFTRLFSVLLRRKAPTDVNQVLPVAAKVSDGFSLNGVAVCNPYYQPKSQR